MEIKTIAEECVQWEHPAPRTPQVKAAGTLSASPASQAEQGSSWRVDPDEAKVLLGFHECFLMESLWEPGRKPWGIPCYVFARREVTTPAQLQALLLELMALLAQEWKGLHQSLRKLQPSCCSLPHFNQPRAVCAQARFIDYAMNFGRFDSTCFSSNLFQA